MITTKAGYPIQIVKGSKKCLGGTKPFLVRFIESEDNKIKRSFNPFKFVGYDGTFPLTRNEMIVENEEELYEAIGLKKEG